jgi:hypothetical protein
MTKRTIGAKQALDDIRSGMEDPELMEKYKLTARGLESLLSKLAQAGLIEEWELERRMPLAQGTAALDISTGTPTLRPFGPTPATKDEDTAGKEISAEKRPSTAKINVDEAVSMIRAGIGDSALMEKYRLSPRGLESLFRKLSQSGFITPEELDRRLEDLEATVDLRSVVEELGLGQPTHVIEPVEVETPNDMEDSGLTKEGASPNKKDSKTRHRTNVYYGKPPGWPDNSSLVIALLFLFFPLGFYGLYKNRELSKSVKITLVVIWGLFAGGIGIFATMFYGDAEEFVRELNTKYGAYTHAELRGTFNTTLRISWTNRTTPEQKRSIIKAIKDSERELINSGIKRVEAPNTSGGFTATNLITGEETIIPDKAEQWIVE